MDTGGEREDEAAVRRRHGIPEEHPQEIDGTVDAVFHAVRRLPVGQVPQRRLPLPARRQRPRAQHRRPERREAADIHHQRRRHVRDQRRLRSAGPFDHSLPQVKQHLGGPHLDGVHARYGHFLFFSFLFSFYRFIGFLVFLKKRQFLVKKWWFKYKNWS